MHSVWSDTVTLPEFEKLEKDIKTDVLIIGGGIAGILCAYMLHNEGVDYVLVEADRICGGITKNTTAKITSQHGLIYHKLLHKFGPDKAWMYLMANEAALDKYRKLCENIDCDFETRDSCVYSLDSLGKIQHEISALQKIGFDAEFTKRTSLPFSIAGGVKFINQAQFHPLKFIFSIVKNLKIYEHTKVRELIGMKAVTNSASITAKKIIVATHFPFINKHGSYFIKLYQDRSYVLALSGVSGIRDMYVDEAQKGLSFREYNGLLLLGGGGHRTGKSGGNWQELEVFAKKHYPSAQIKYRWATQDCMSLDSVPYIGNYSARTPDLYVAAGFNKWGMTSSMAAAMILSDMIQGRKNPYAEVFSPSRTILRAGLAVNGFESAVNLLTPSVKRCPHLGCALKWNRDERSWDCPCHGSRFTEDGDLIDNPASADIKKKRG